MVATDKPEGFDPREAAPPSRRRRSSLLIFGRGLVVLIGLGASVLVASQFFLTGPERAAGMSLALEPALIETPRPAPQFSLIEPRSLGGQLVADPALIEDSPFGPLPVIAADGRAPMAAYARSFDDKDKRPRIAVIVGGLNVSANNSRLALARLPAPVTLAFAPFAFDAQALVDRAREAGHEVLLAVPMEPYDFPESDPGPNALMAAASAEENIRRLNWSLSRFTGYVGITNLLGARFMSEQSALDPVLKEIARRGLIFVDNGASRNSLALTATRHAGGAIATGTLILDDVQSKDAIDKRLAELEADARRNGSAVGVGSAFPVTIARIAEWAESMDSRGLTLVPVSALAVKPAQQDQASARH
jgi:polysaccharide deacetylase 2 family uncharacterized protein YibQ